MAQEPASAEGGREIPDDWLNDYSTYQQCFVCGQHNEHGLRTKYRQEGDRIITVFTGEARHQGFPGVVHGGLISSLLDETMGRTALFERAWVMTGRLEVRYRKPAPVGEPLTVSAWPTRVRGLSVEARGEVRSSDGELLADGKGLFLKVPEEVKRQAQEAHPEFAEYFNAGMPRDEG
ncbi:MAG TPA: PaaI family thioesterase [Candidatus Dormibacteraeota bacterium]|nr:PaaI family thioesterase [Candidatus Dormibacteraeota bacterium]